MDWIEPVLLASLLAGFALGISNHAHVIGILRDRHPETWRSLGSPTLVLNNSAAKGLRLRRYLGSRAYEALGDADLGRTVRIGRRLEVAYLLVFLLFLIRFALALPA